MSILKICFKFTAFDCEENSHISSYFSLAGFQELALNLITEVEQTLGVRFS